MPEADTIAEENRELRQLVHASAMALRSYQFGNGSPDLAASIASDLESWLVEHGETLPCTFVHADVEPTRQNPGLVRRPFVLPAVMTPAIRDALGMMNFRTGPIAHAFRQFGNAPIERRCEDEQAVVLHWFLSLAVKHGDDWRQVVAQQLSLLKPGNEDRPSEVAEGRP